MIQTMVQSINPIFDINLNTNMNNYNQRFKDCTLNDINAQALRNAWLYKSSNRFYSFFFTGVFYSRKLAENREGF